MTLPIAPSHARQLAALRVAAPTTRVVVVGAAALGHHLPLDRDTKDIDLALAVEQNEVAPLMARVCWEPDRREAQRWNGPDAFRVDIVPATPALIRAGKVQLAGGHHTLSLVGFDLAYEYAEAVDLPGTESQIEVASLLSLVVLKMTAFLDRPYARTKDLVDLDMVLRHALAEDDERRWAPPLRAAGVDFDHQSAFFVGDALARLVTEVHRVRIDAFVDMMVAEVGTDWGTVTARETGHRAPNADERVRDRWRAFRRGFSPGE